MGSWQSSPHFPLYHDIVAESLVIRKSELEHSFKGSNMAEFPNDARVFVLLNISQDCIITAHCFFSSMVIKEIEISGA